MSSIPALSSILKSLTSLTAYRIQPTSPGDTVTTAALARAAATIPVSSLTGFADTEPFFVVGDGGTELNSVSGTPAAGNIVPARPIAIAQASGARVVEAVAYALGHVAEGSAKAGASSSSVPIPAATSATPIGFLSTGGELNFGFGLLSLDTRSIALAYGMDELETGAGTSGDPYTTVISQGSVGSHGLLCIRGRGVRKDGKIVELDLLDCTIDAAADVNFSGKAVNPIPVAGKCTAHIYRIW